MKKKLLISALILSAFVLLAGLVWAVFPVLFASDRREATSVTTAYLEEAARARYFYESRDLERFTISSVPSDERNDLTRLIAEYPGFRSAQDFLPDQETRIHSNQLAPFLENLSLHRDGVAYYAYLNQLEEIAYKSFSPSYQVNTFVMDGDLAMLDLYETLDFQYGDCDESSGMTTRYDISLVKHRGKWLILAVESDDMLYQAYREAGFDLEHEIAGVTDAFIDK